MWNDKDVYLAAERYADMRRSAEQHNAAAQMRAEMRRERPSSKRSYTVQHYLRKALALRSTYVYR
jgi:hypothetical protein